MKQMLNLDTMSFKWAMNMTKIQQPKMFLSELFHSALTVVHGTRLVNDYLQDSPIEGKVAILAIGKAAPSMIRGAEIQLNDQIHSALVITKEGHAERDLDWPCIEAGHPLPDARSLVAGDKLLEFIKKLPEDVELLTLISGGASSLVEVLPENMGLEELQKMNQWLLASGLAIHQINRVRQSVSLIKGGKLLEYLGQRAITQLLISDVKNDDPGIIGSGLLVASEQQSKLPVLPDWIGEFIQEAQPTIENRAKSHIVASNEMACQAVISKAKKANFAPHYHGQTLYGDVFEITEQLASEIKKARPGIHVWGGETTINLPESPGRGGRNQSLALSLACALQGTKNITVLVGATDGTDGPTNDAGAIIDGFSLKRAEMYPGHAKVSLTAADAGTFLAAAGDLISTGPTGTNVMDVVIALIE